MSDQQLSKSLAGRIRTGIAVVVGDMEETVSIQDGRHEPVVLSLHAAGEFAGEVMDLIEAEPGMARDVAELIVASGHVAQLWGSD
jgi:hypothetical protein